MSREGKASSRAILFWVTILNYVAQVPYYFHNYYFHSHSLPAMRGVLLLGSTLIWFLIGYFGMAKGRRSAYWLLLSFLLFEALFYFRSLVFGAFVFQMRNPSWELKEIFFIGYISGITAAYYAYDLFKERRRSALAP